MNQKHITRASGAGNTFFILNLQDQAVPELQLQRLAQKICRQPGVAATDGFLAITKKTKKSFKWSFYNSDGSKAEMCGNAARCVGRYIFENVDPSLLEFSIETGAGEVRVAKTGSDKISVQMNPVKDLRKMEVSLAEGTPIKGLSVDTGVPHFVTSQSLSKEQCATLRRQTADFPRGSNITLVTFAEGHKISAVSFERGVEDFTPACGTGAVAAAYWLKEFMGVKETIDVQMPGGSLTVQFPVGDNSPILTGNAELQFSELIDLDTL